MSFDTLFRFEKALSEYTGAPYVVATDGCTHALELCFRYKHVKYCEFPARTYLSILQMLNQLNIHYRLTDKVWIGEYHFYDTKIWDSARRLERGMYRPGTLQCLSFGHDKPLSLGKAGAILLDDAEAYYALSQMRSDGRDLQIEPWQNQTVFHQGYHYCPTLETCALGLERLPFVNILPKYHEYPDLRTIDFL
jgi:dTDP-4-amino-4,6-dideoxygalactose transaminase